MGLVGNEIVQSRIWLKPNPEPEPQLNYKNAYPVTVFEAVHKNMDPDSANLATILNEIERMLISKQRIIPAKPANFLMTYGGADGAVGSIQISSKIPWKSEEQSQDKIPTEKAVGDLLKRYGVINEDGSGTIRDTILWTDIVGRPNIYNDLGSDDEGIITQKGLTSIINEIKENFNNYKTSNDDTIFNIQVDIDNHVTNKNNPHNVTVAQIGAASQESFLEHINNTNNPHNITAETIGLENVNNTSDENKPISIATQAAIDKVTNLIRSLTNTFDESKYIVRLEYDQERGRLNAIYNDDTRMGVSIITDGLIDEVNWNEDTHILKFTELNGRVYSIDFTKAFQAITSYTGTHINIDIVNEEVQATIVPNSITSNEIKENSIESESYKDQSIINDKIKDLTITGYKLADETIESRSIANGAIENINVHDRAIDGRTLFTSDEDNRVLTVTKAGTDPRWTLINEEMLDSKSVGTRQLIDKSIIGIKIADNTINGISIKDETITGDKIAQDTIRGESLIKNANFLGTPTLEINPLISSNNQEITTTSWVRELLKSAILGTNNIIDRSITGAKLFSTNIKNRALIVTEMDADSYWGQINHEMIEDEAVGTNNIKNDAVTSEKLDNASVTTRNIAQYAITSEHLSESSVTPYAIFTSDESNRVLAAVTQDGHPKYTKVTQPMMDHNSVGTWQIEDQSVTLAKLAHSDIGEAVLGVELKSHDPIWTKIKTQMIKDGAITSDKLWVSPQCNMVLGSVDANTPATYTKVNGRMIENDSISGLHIIEGTVESKHIKLGAIGFNQIANASIDGKHLIESTIGPRELFKSDQKNTVLVTSNDLTTPYWGKITSEMIEDTSVKPEKLFTSEEYDHRVIGIKEAGSKPEYIRITGQYIEDGTIGSSKLGHNLELYGHPKISDHPRLDSNDYTIADTAWVNNKLNNLNIDLNGKVEIDIANIPDHSIRLSKLSNAGLVPGVLGITEEDGNARYMKIGESLIKNGAITKNKLQHDIELYGSPRLNVRPAPQSSDEFGMGNIIPDCQWVLDRIEDKNREFYQLLKEKINCLQGPDPDQENYEKFSLANIGDDRIEGIVDGTIEPIPQLLVQVGPNTLLGPIPDSNVEGIVDGTLDPEMMRNLNLGSVEIEPITLDRLDGIIEGTVEPDSNSNVVVNSYNECGCNGNGTSYRNFRFVSRINNERIGYIMDGLLKPTVVEPFSIETKSIESIPDKQLEEMVDGTTRVDEHTEVIVWKDHAIVPIEKDRIIEIMRNEVETVKTVGLDITEYPEFETVKVGADLIDDSVITSYIQDRAVTGRKLFSSTEDNMILAVIEANTDPVWTKVTHEMIEDWIMKVNLISSSDINDRIIGVRNAGDEPSWMQINHNMLEDNIINENNIIDNAVTTDKIADWNITKEKLAREEMINTVHLVDRAVTERKIQNNSISTEKIIDRSVTGEKIAREQTIPAYTKVEENTEYERRALRNTIISPNAPLDIQAGDIWFKVI